MPHRGSGGRGHSGRLQLQHRRPSGHSPLPRRPTGVLSTGCRLRRAGGLSSSRTGGRASGAAAAEGMTERRWRVSTGPGRGLFLISNALRATGRLDDFEVAALVLAGVMKKVHLRHFSYREDAACGQPYPTLLTDDRDRATCGRCRRIGMASAAKVEAD